MLGEEAAVRLERRSAAVKYMECAGPQRKRLARRSGKESALCCGQTEQAREGAAGEEGGCWRTGRRRRELLAKSACKRRQSGKNL